MSGNDIRDTVGLLAVVAGLVFVGLEIRSNTLVAQAATRQAIVDGARDYYLNIINNDELRNLLVATSADTSTLDLSPSDDLLLRYHHRIAIDIMENGFYHFENGTLDGEYWGTLDRAFRSALLGPSGSVLRRYWGQMEDSYAGSFVDYVNGILAGPIDG